MASSSASDEDRESQSLLGGRGKAPMEEGEGDAITRKLSRGASRYLELHDIDLESATAKFGVEGKPGRSKLKLTKGLGEALGTGTDTFERLARLKRMAGFECHNYEPLENDIEREASINRPHSDYEKKAVAEWVIAGLIGVSMGVIAFLVDVGIETLVDWKYETTKEFIEEDAGFWTPYLVYILFCGGYATIAGALVSYVEPLAAGSGIPELKTYLNGVELKGLMSLKTLVAKLVGITFSIGSGLIAGKEGPFVHGGGIVGGGLGAMGSSSLGIKVPGSVSGNLLRTEASHRDFTAIGTAAGVATAFAAPIGGVLFTVEEGASFYSTSIFWRGFLSTCLGVLTLHWLVEWKTQPSRFMSLHMGIRRDFGLYEDDVAQYGTHYWYYAWEIPIFAFVGLLGGWAGALFVRLNIQLTAFRHRWIPIRCPARRNLEVVLVAVVTGTVFFLAAWGSPCKALPEGHPGLYDTAQSLAGQEELQEEELLSGGTRVQVGQPVFFDRLWCPEGQYSEYGQLFFAPLAQSLRLLLHLGETVGDEGFQYAYGYGVLVTFWLVCSVLMLWTYGVGAATGLFVPSLTCGAAMGRLVGQIVSACLVAAGKDIEINLSTYAVLGAAASLGGATRMTLSITVLVMETTGSLQLITPLMLVILVSKVIGDRYSHGIYDAHIKIRGAPLLEEADLDEHAKMVQDKLVVSELMSEAMVAFPPVPTVRDVVRVLGSCSHGVFPVTPDPESALSSAKPVDLLGVIERKTLLKMLQHKIAFMDPGATSPRSRGFGIPASQEARLSILEKLEHIPFKAHEETILKLLTDRDMGMLVDLQPIMQRHPVVVGGSCTMARAYRLFRTLGVHHMLVAPEPHRVCGLITRKDLVEENLLLALGEKAAGLLREYDPKRENLPFVPYTPYDRSADSGRAENVRGEPYTLNPNRENLPFVPYTPYDRSADSGRAENVRGEPYTLNPNRENLPFVPYTPYDRSADSGRAENVRASGANPHHTEGAKARGAGRGNGGGGGGSAPGVSGEAAGGSSGGERPPSNWLPSSD